MNEEKEKRGLFFKAPDRWKNLIIIGGLIGIALIFLSSSSGWEAFYCVL